MTKKETMKRLTVGLTPETSRRMDEFSAKNGRLSRTAIARMAIAEFLHRELDAAPVK